MNNLAVILKPSQEDDLVCGIAAHETQSGISTNPVPASWGGFNVHLVEVSALVPSVFKSGGLDGDVTHLALLERKDDDEGTPYFFGGKSVTKLGMALWYCAAHEYYRFLHCKDCGTIVATWIAEHADRQENAARSVN